MLCLPLSPSTQFRLPLWSKLIPHANLSKRDSEPGGKTGIVVSVLPQTLLPVTIRAFQWERPRCSETPSLPKPGDHWGQDHVHHHGSSHHHRPDPATEILQQNQAVSNVCIAQECVDEDSRGVTIPSPNFYSVGIIILLHFGGNRLMSLHFCLIQQFKSK